MDETKPNIKQPSNGSTAQKDDLIGGMTQDLANFFSKVKKFIHDITDIKEGLDEQGTRDSIKKNIQIKGSNIWLLGSAIMVASLGLDLDSPAVIIGAMLISPLMSPILGVGLSIGINDRTTLYESLYHFGIAIAVSLIVSTIYFFITPLGEPTGQIIARTSPTLLDVLVAFFGGIAGIVSGSRLEKSNAIPGVAIATALLPPLCVSGYGLANGDWVIFINSFYLFFLNCVFIALATFLVVRFLNFRPKKYVDTSEQKRASFAMAIFVLVMIIPSVFILGGVAKEIGINRDAKRYVTENFMSPNRDVRWTCRTMLDKKGNKTDSLILSISLLGETIPKDSIPLLESYLPKFNLKNTHLTVIQTQTEDINNYNEKEKVVLRQQEEAINKVKTLKNAEIRRLESQVDSLKSAGTSLAAINVLYPEVEDLSFGNLQSTDSAKTVIPTLTILWKKNTSSKYKQMHNERIGLFLQKRIGLDTIQILERN